MMTHHAGGMLSDSVVGLRQQQEWGLLGTVASGPGDHSAHFPSVSPEQLSGALWGPRPWGPSVGSF